LISADRGLLGRRLFGAGRGELIAGGLAQTGRAEDMISSLEARALWARYGL
jgi:hypothetical protein